MWTVMVASMVRSIIRAGVACQRWSPRRHGLELAKSQSRRSDAIRLDEYAVSTETCHPVAFLAGGLPKLHVHQILEPLLRAYSLDSTIIEEKSADVEDCDGPTEVVLPEVWVYSTSIAFS